MKRLILSLQVAIALFACALFGQPVKKEPPTSQDEKMKWFREAKFGLFIHWGLYAVPAGEWKGQPIAGIGEWIMNRAKIPVKEYEQLATQFNPTKFNAEAWVQMAEDAGMKYIVITSKHHDGFAMYRSSVSKYNIFDATPFHRDPLKELAGELFVLGDGDARAVHDPLADAGDGLAAVLAGGDGVEAPVDEHAEAGVAPPGHACVALGGGFGVLNGGYGVIHGSGVGLGAFELSVCERGGGKEKAGSDGTMQELHEVSLR